MTLRFGRRQPRTPQNLDAPMPRTTLADQMRSAAAELCKYAQRGRDYNAAMPSGLGEMIEEKRQQLRALGFPELPEFGPATAARLAAWLDREANWTNRHRGRIRDRRALTAAQAITDGTPVPGGLRVWLADLDAELFGHQH